MKQDGSRLQIRITSDPANVPLVRHAVEQTARTAGFSPSDVDAVKLAIDEAICNVIRHGYEGRTGQPIVVMAVLVLRSDRRALEFVIMDEGRQVDPATIVGRDLDHVRPGGLGTHIIRRVMDEICYSRGQERGMVLRMLKYIDAGPIEESRK